MKATSPLFLSAFLLSVGIQGQEEPSLEIQLHPSIRVTGEAGATYVIESMTDLEGDFWLTRGVVEMNATLADWFDTVPAAGHQRYYRAVKVTKPEVEPIENMV